MSLIYWRWSPAWLQKESNWTASGFGSVRSSVLSLFILPLDLSRGIVCLCAQPRFRRSRWRARSSTNGKVEPVNNIEIHAPIPATVKAVYVQAGDTVPAGKLLMQLDDIDARAKLAGADSAVKSAQASLEAATQNGTLEQRQGVTAEIARDKLVGTRRSRIWMPW